MYTRNGYVMVYKPEHKRASSDGMVYEHIVKAEEYLGRELNDGEVVHHEDRCRDNNSEDNLFVFKTDTDHARYHKNNQREKLDDGSYYSPRSPKSKKKCSYCMTMFEPKDSNVAYCSQECAKLDRRVVDRPSKEELYNLLKTNSFSALGLVMGVSDNAIRKWCRAYGIPDKASYYRSKY